MAVEQSRGRHLLKEPPIYKHPNPKHTLTHPNKPPPPQTAQHCCSGYITIDSHKPPGDSVVTGGGKRMTSGGQREWEKDRRRAERGEMNAMEVIRAGAVRWRAPDADSASSPFFRSRNVEAPMRKAAAQTHQPTAVLSFNRLMWLWILMGYLQARAWPVHVWGVGGAARRIISNEPQLKPI